VKRFAIVGAGPSGATAAERLAASGFEVALFDPKGAWEKPCGGGVTTKALDRYAYLVDAPDWPSQPVERIALVGPSRRRIALDLDRPFRIYSRSRLNGLLLERARAAGAEFVNEAVSGFERLEGGGWRVATKAGEWRADVLVGADGAGSVVRRDLAGRFKPTDVALTMGYNAPGGGSTEVVIDFPPGLTGYVWAFPRTDHANFGIIARLNERPAAEMKQLLHEFVDGYYGGRAPYDAMEFYGAKVPMLAHGSWEQVRAAGPDWALVGDAAGFVDPITGEGIYFAIRSGELFAEAIANGSGLAGYDRAWYEDFGEDLAVASRHLERFYHGRFLGAPVIDRALLFSERHPGFRRVMKRALGGEQSYLTLKRDLVVGSLRFV
jgi:geranylgeranyl reductase family protein